LRTLSETLGKGGRKENVTALTRSRPTEITNKKGEKKSSGRRVVSKRRTTPTRKNRVTESDRGKEGVV